MRERRGGVRLICVFYVWRKSMIKVEYLFCIYENDCNIECDEVNV